VLAVYCESSAWIITTTEKSTNRSYFKYLKLREPLYQNIARVINLFPVKKTELTTGGEGPLR
jgi:hypothetical protein